MNSVDLKRAARQLGADVCGIAAIEQFGNAPDGFHPTNIFADARSVIIIGCQFPDGTFLAHSNAPYTLVRNQLIQKNDTISVELSLQIENAGGKAMPIPSGEPYEYWDAERRHGRGIVSLKHSAQLAGLGFIGKNTLLINRSFGNRLWLGGIITDFAFEPDGPTIQKCPDHCTVCLDICPQAALNGITIDQKKCREICFTSTEGGGWLIACNLCRVKCPKAH